MSNERKLIIKLSGTAIGSDVNSAFDYLGRFGRFIASVNATWTIAITVGGGEVARRYIVAAKNLGLSDSQASVLGGDIGLIHSRLVIAALTRSGVKVHSSPIDKFADAEAKLKAGLIPVLFGRWPGLTSDSVAAYFADFVSADLVLKLSRVDAIYDSNPSGNTHAIPNRRLSHEQLESLSAQNDKRIAGEEFVIDLFAAKRLRNSNIPLWLLDMSKLELASTKLSRSHFRINEGTLVGDLAVDRD